MSYKTIFAGVAGTLGAAALSTQMAHAEPEFHNAQMIGMAMDDIIPPAVRPFIGDLEVDLQSGVNFDDGFVDSTYTRVNATDIECDVIEPVFEAEDERDIELNEKYGYERSAAEQAFVDSIRTLFQDRVLDLDKEDLMAILGPEAGMMIPMDLMDKTSVDVHLECAGYQAPPPSMTPVEPR